MQALALNCMARKCGATWWIPVLSGDLNRNLVLHLAAYQVIGCMQRVVAAAPHRHIALDAQAAYNHCIPPCLAA